MPSIYGNYRPKPKGKGTWNLQEVEQYQRLHYVSKIKPHVTEALKGRKLTPGERLQEARKISRDLYSHESAEVKNEVKAARQAAIERKRERDQVDDQSGERKPEHYQRYVIPQ